MSNKRTIKTTWRKIFESADYCILFNNYPEIAEKCNPEELYQWYKEDDTNEIFQWYIIDDYTSDWLKRFCPEIYEDVYYSETLGKYVMAVYHFGTPWSGVSATLDMTDADDDLYELYKKQYEEEA